MIDEYYKEKIKPYGVIYQIKNVITGQCNIGQSTQCYTRFKQYKNLHCKSQPNFYNALKEYGIKNFEFNILCECFSREEIDLMEDYYILKFNSIKDGYNMRPGGHKGKNTEETKRKMSLARTGRIMSEETRKKIGDAHRAPHGPCCNRIWPQYQKDKLKGRTGEKSVKFGKPMSKETKKLLSDSQKEEKSLWKNKKHSEKTINQISDKKKYKTIHKFVNTVTNEEFIGITYDFFTKYNLSPPKVSNIIKGKRNHHKNWIHIVDENDIKFEPNIYKIVNMEGEIFSGTFSECRNKIGSTIREMGKLVGMRVRFVNNWKLFDTPKLIR